MHVDPTLLSILESDGVTIVPGVLAPERVAVLREELERAMAEDLVLRPTAFDKGMVHNCMVRGQAMADLLDNETMAAYLDEAFSPTCIVYAYQSSSLPPGDGNYGSRVHVDSPRFIPGYATNLGVIFPLDDFTLDNGATHYSKGSHLRPDMPDDKTFFAQASRAVCSAGDMILFNGRMVHASGVNKTSRTRHSLTINICRSFMRQRFDFPRLVPPQTIERLGNPAGD